MHQLFPRALAVLVCGALGAAPAANPIGGLSAIGTVWTNQVALPSGSTVYAGDVIKTAPDALAIVASPTLGRIEVRPGSEARFEARDIVLQSGAVASSDRAIRIGDVEVQPLDASADNWFVLAEKDGERIVAAHRGDVEIRSASGSTRVPGGSFAVAAAGKPADAAEDSAAGEPEAAGTPEQPVGPQGAKGKAASVGSKSGWSLGPLGTATSVVVVSGIAAGVATGFVAGGGTREEAVSPQ